MQHYRYAIELSYHGGKYFGWQRQQGQLSVQQVLEQTFSNILDEKTVLVGCGRTDKGVHAHRYWAHFDSARILSKLFLLRANKYLPTDIALHTIHQVHPEWHARFDAIKRTYRYFIHFEKDPFLVDRSYWLRSLRPDRQKMEEVCALIKQYDDFGIFEKKGSGNSNSRCTIFEATWEVENAEQGKFYFEITANRFLRNMVRRITATMLEVGIGKLSLQQLKEAMDGNAILKTSMAVPAEGLHLWQVIYNDQFISGADTE